MNRELNKEQLTALSNLSFDLAKGTLSTILVPAFGSEMDPIIRIGGIIIAFFGGLAFTYMGLLLLRAKGRLQT